MFRDCFRERCVQRAIVFGLESRLAASNTGPEREGADGKDQAAAKDGAKRPKKVWTDDDIPKRASGGSAGSDSATSKTKAAPAPNAANTEDSADDEKPDHPEYKEKRREKRPKPAQPAPPPPPQNPPPPQL